MVYAYGTARNVSIMRSRDLVHWERVGTAFTDETRPSFEPKAGIWAPDVTRVGDKYVMYYSMSVWGGEWTCGIGCAVADRPEGPFVDKGKLFRSNEIGVKNSIDPFYIEENGHKYLFWGSFRGIYWIELSDDGFSVKPGAKPQLEAGRADRGWRTISRGGSTATGSMSGLDTIPRLSRTLPAMTGCSTTLSSLTDLRDAP